MQTITFYAYKGGTGRSLVLANAAKYLARLGQRVVCLDLDLEAPGLHHKLWLDRAEPSQAISYGVVDWFHHFTETNAIDESLQRYALPVPGEEEGTGSVKLIPAGNILSRTYWKRLASIDWHKLFFSEKPIGVPLFLELKALIQKQFSPDFLLIDARTGITEVGGVATTLLPDQVICLLLNNTENLEGAREVLRGIKAAPRLPDQNPIDLMTVLSRVPTMRGHRNFDEVSIVEEVKSFLNEPNQQGEGLDISEVLVLHSEDTLQATEAIRVGSRTVDQSLLLRDYLRLFSRVIPNEAVVPHLDKLVSGAFGRMIDSPEEAQNDLEALATYCPHPASLLPLLKYYRLRNAPPEKILDIASRYWELSNDSQSDVVWDTIRKHFRFDNKDQTSVKPKRYTPEFIESVWKAAGGDNIEVAISLATLYQTQLQTRKALNVLEYMLAHIGDDERGVTAAISNLLGAEQWDAAASVINRYRGILSVRPSFQAAWANLAVSRADAEMAQAIVGMKEFSPAQMQASQPATYARLLKLAGRTDELNAVLSNLIAPALADRVLTPKLYEMHQLFVELGKRNMFETYVREIIPAPRASRILTQLGFNA